VSELVNGSTAHEAENPAQNKGIRPISSMDASRRFNRNPPVRPPGAEHHGQMSGGWRLGRRPSLDGVRGVAVLLVVTSHTTHTLTGRSSLAGGAGVAMFFSLSGFLITAILLEGQNFATFYRHRFLRLAPALVVFVLVAGALQDAITGVAVGRNWPALLYLANWMQVPGPWFGHLWTLGVEEQFYIVWPVAFLLSRRWRHGPLVLCLAGLAASLACKLALWDGGAGAARVYAGSDTEAWALLTGCLLAVLARQGLPPLRRPRLAAAGVGCLFGLCLVGVDPTQSALVVPLVVPVIAAALIWMVCSLPPRVLETTALRHVGLRSYALYLWHPVFLALAVLAVGRSVPGVLLGLALSGLAAEASWWCVERPFLRLKSTGAPRPELAAMSDPEPAVVTEPQAAWSA
jgi:peptidoglycan/LPS O-acetylase OafA/YrhL